MPIVDFDLQFLVEFIGFLDQNLSKHIETSTKGPEDADSLGVLDRIEYIIGIGFVACQTYITSLSGRYELDKKNTLTIGPMHISGVHIATIINNGANYWKHSDEWTKALRPTKSVKRIESTFRKLGTSTQDDYPLSNLLAKVNGRRNIALIPIVWELETWAIEARKLRNNPHPE